MRPSSLLALATIATATLASQAHAHINMVGDIKARTDQGGLDEQQKNVPCDGARGDGPVYTFQPGTIITLALDEVVQHPGYYRVAFDKDGDDFKDPQSIKPVERLLRLCPMDGDAGVDQCGEPDFCNTPEVLYDNLNPHLAVGIIAGARTSWNIKLPDVECDNCTLQVIQVMMDDGAHGPYCALDDKVCRAKDNSAPDVYHRCIDLKLQKGAKDSAGTATAVSLPTDNKYIDCQANGGGAGADAGGGPDATADAGTTTSEPNDKADAGTGSSSGGATKDAGTKKDASTSTKSDAGKASDDSDTPTAKSDEGCALASSHAGGAAWTLLALGLLLARRRRFRTA